MSYLNCPSPPGTSRPAGRLPALTIVLSCLLKPLAQGTPVRLDLPLSLCRDPTIVLTQVTLCRGERIFWKTSSAVLCVVGSERGPDLLRLGLWMRM